MADGFDPTQFGTKVEEKFDPHQFGTPVYEGKEQQQVAERPTPVAPPTAGAKTLARPAMPGTSLHNVALPQLEKPPEERTNQSVALTPEMRESRGRGMEAAKVAAPLAVTLPFVAAPIAEAGGASLAEGSVRPLLAAGKEFAKTAIKGYLGSKAGGYVGEDVGSWVGHPKEGKIAGEVAGGLYGAGGGKVPTKAGVIKSILGMGEAEAPAAAEEVAATKAAGTHVPSEPIMGTNEPAPKPAGPLTERQIGTRIKAGVEQAAGTTAETPIYKRPVAPENTVGAKTVAAEPNPEAPMSESNIRTPSRAQTLVGRTEPIAPTIPIKESPAAFSRPAGPPVEETVHPMDRQFIHVNGAQAFEKTAENPGLREDLYQLRGKQLMEVLRKSGVNMSNIETVGEAGGKAARGGTVFNPKNIARNEAFDMLFERGYTPEQILKEAPTAEELGLKAVQRRKPFGPAR